MGVDGCPHPLRGAPLVVLVLDAMEDFMTDPIPGITNPIEPPELPPPPPERETVSHARAALDELRNMVRDRQGTAKIGEIRDPRQAPILMTRLEYEGLVARVEDLERRTQGMDNWVREVSSRLGVG